MTIAEGERGAPTPEADYRRFFQSSPGRYLVLTPELFIVDATDAYLAATMTRREDIVGRAIFDVFPDNPDDDTPTGTRNLRASLELVRRDLVWDSMAVQKYDVRRPESEGGGFEERYWSPTNVPITDEFGRLAFILHRVVDVTDYTRFRWGGPASTSSSDDRAYEDAMAAEIYKRGLELQEANHRLVAQDRAKSDFLSRMSHELRTPLNSILGFSQLLERELDDDEHRDSVDHITKAGRHLLQLINEVLDIARIESRQMEISLEPVGVDEIVDHVVRLMAPVAAQQAVRLDASFSGRWFVRADRQRLEQVLLNLLSNAIKYNRPHGEVRVSVANVDGRRLRIAVADTGIGIAESDYPSVFEPFSRVGAAQSTVEGTGIGLALTKRLVELMGGAISFTSERGTGTTFSVDLDLTTEPAHQLQRIAHSSSRRASHGWSGRILYVEDNLANLTLVKRILRGEPGVEVLSAMQGGIGLEMARQNRPRLILLDVHLPDMLGQEFIAALRSSDTVHDVPVVVLSADATDRQITRLLDAGAAAYLTKPLDVEEFESVLDAHLSMATAADTQ